MGLQLLLLEDLGCTYLKKTPVSNSLLSNQNIYHFEFLDKKITRGT